MGNLNPLADILNDGKLIYLNYMSWKRKVSSVLIVKEVGWILNIHIPLMPGIVIAEQKEYDHWCKSN